MVDILVFITFMSDRWITLDIEILSVVVLKKSTFWFYNIVIRPKDADEMANSADPDQTALYEQSDLGL